MKVKSLINCTGVGYINFKKNEVRNLPEKLAAKLIKFGYAEKTSATVTPSQKDDEKPDGKTTDTDKE